MTAITIQYVCLAVIVLLCVLVYTGDKPPKRPLLWPCLIAINLAMCIIASWDHIQVFEQAHPWAFWGYALPAVTLAVGAFFEGLIDRFAWFFVTALMAVLPVINIVALLIIVSIMTIEVVRDPKYMWRGMKNRFNFTKKA